MGLKITEIREYSDRKVCVLGLGYVGLTLAVAMADIGFDVLGVEVRESVLASLSKGEAHFHEPGLEDKLREVIASEKFTFSREIPNSWDGRVFIITVGTPLSSEGKSRLDMIESVTKQVANALKNGDLIIMRSTVKLGTTRNLVMPILNETGYNYELAFCPERTLEGKALTELRSLPQIVGGSTYRSGIRASQLFQLITPTVVRVSDIETAEMIKLIDNAQRDVAFAYANEVALACDSIGISAAEVINAGKLGYARTNLPMPGPVGGPCLEKDPHILIEGLDESGLSLGITKAARLINEGLPKYVVDYIEHITSRMVAFPKNPIISMMGLAFKGQPATDDLRGTMAKPVFEALKIKFPNSVYRGFDAVVHELEIQKIGLVPTSSIEQAFESSSLVIILNNHPIFNSMSITKLAGQMSKPGIIYDFWNFFDASDLHLPAGVSYIALGSHGKARILEGAI